MAPKESKKEKDAKRKLEQEAEDLKRQKKVEQSTAITLAKSLAKTTKEGAADAQRFLDLYQGCSRFDDEKTKLLAEWKKNNKKFTFTQTYKKSESNTHETAASIVKGWGSRCPASKA